MTRSLSATGDQVGAVDVGRKIDDVERTVDGAVGLERGEVEACEVVFVVDPGGIDLGFFLFLLAGGFGIVGPEGEVFAVIADGEAGDVDGLRLLLSGRRVSCRLSFRSIRERGWRRIDGVLCLSRHPLEAGS